LGAISGVDAVSILFATTPLPLLSFDRGWRIIDLNEAAEQVFGEFRRLGSRDQSPRRAWARGLPALCRRLSKAPTWVDWIDLG
jgi:PAS domain-containing protein